MRSGGCNWTVPFCHISWITTHSYTRRMSVKRYWKIRFSYNIVNVIWMYIFRCSQIVISIWRTTAILHNNITFDSYLPAFKILRMRCLRELTFFPQTMKPLTVGEGGGRSSARAIFLQFPSDFAHNSIGHRMPGKTFKLYAIM